MTAASYRRSFREKHVVGILVVRAFGRMLKHECSERLRGLKESHMATMAKMIQTEQKTVAYYESKIGFRAKFFFRVLQRSRAFASF